MENNYTTKQFAKPSTWRKIMLICIAFMGGIIGAQAQISSYTFTQTAGAYTPIVGGTLLKSGTFDDQTYLVNIPAFNFNGTLQTSLTVSANGFLVFGTVLGSNYVPLSSAVITYKGAVSAFGRDLNQAATGSPEIRYQQIGDELIFQWKDARRLSIPSEILNFQIRLNTLTNNIQVVYGACTPGSNPTYPQVGLRGATNAFPANVNNREVIAGTGNWINSTQPTTNTRTCYFNSATPATVPSSGLTYQWTAPCFAQNVPYIENFDAVTIPAIPTCTSVIDVNADAVSWYTEDLFAAWTTPGYTGNSLMYQYNNDGTTDGNDWFFTKGINLIGGTSYTLAYNYGAESASYPESMDVFYGSGASVVAMTNSLATHPSITTVFNNGSVMFVPATSGVYYMGFHAYSAADNWNLYLDDISVDLSFPPCVTPAGLTAYNLTTTSAVLSWTGTVPTNWEVEYGVTSYTFTGTPNATFTTNPATFTGLAASTNYKIQIRSNCSGVPSAWTTTVNFTTPCSATSVPYNEGFESITVANQLPACMAITNAAINLTNIAIASNNRSARNGTDYASFRFGTNAAGDWFFFAPVNLTGGTTYRASTWYSADGAGGWSDLSIYYNSAQSAVGATQITSTTAITNTAYLELAGDFTPAVTGVYYIGVKAIGNGTPWYLNIDDVSVDLPPACAAPTALAAYNFTTTSAVLSWTGAAVTNWEVEYGVASYTFTGTPNATFTTNPRTLTGLTASTSYKIQIRANCAGTPSAWTTAVNFTTACGAASIPYTENFDGATTPNLPTCTSREDINADTKTWTTASGVSSYTGNVARYTYSTPNAANDWFYTAGLSLTGGVSYDLAYKYGNSAGYPEDMEVKYGTAATVASMTIGLATHTTIITPVNTNLVSFTPASTGTYYIGFHAYSDADQNVLNLDEISVIVTPACAAPTALTAYNYTATSAVLSWTGAAVTNWEVEYGTAPYTFTTTPNATFTTNSATLAGLTASTNYQIKIRANCAGTPSAWTTAVNFTTACGAASIPYNEGFESITVANQIPSCMAITNPTINLTNIVTASNNRSARTGTDYASFRWGTNAAGDWFFFAPINLTGGTTYRASAWYSADGAGGWSDLSIYYNTAQSAVGATQITSTTAITNTAYQELAGNFTPAVTGVYYIGIKAIGSGAPWYLNIDDISVVIPNTNSSLSALTTSLGTLSPTFVSTTTNYTVSLPFGSTGAASVTPTVATTLSTVNNTGASNVAGVSPANMATVVVTAQSGATSTYTVTYNVTPANTNSSLTALTTSVGTLSPTFASGTFAYTVNLPFGSTGAASVTPTRATTLSAITSNTGASDVAGISPANVATVVVTAQSGATSTYTVTYNVTPANTNSSLTALTTSVGTLSPTFASGTFAYTVTLPFGSTGAASVTPTVGTTLSTVNNTGASNVAGISPANVATVVVTAQSGATSTYTVTYNIAAGNSNSSLTALTTSRGTLSPAFAGATFNYTVTLPFGSTGAASVTPTRATTLSAITSNTGATDVAGISPANVATVVVTAQSGATSTYTVTYNIAAANTNSSLTALTTSRGTLSPAFAGATFNYTVTLPFGSTGTASVTPTRATTLSVITSNTGATDVAGISPANVATVVVTAQSGATSTYTVTYNIAAPNTNSSLTALTTSVGTLSPAFAGATFNYTVTLPFGSTGTASVTPTRATTLSVITSNTGATDVAGSAGANVATVVVTAQSGATSTYTVTYNVTVGSNDATLNNLTSNTGTLSPSFVSSLTSYNVVLPFGTTGGATIIPTLNNGSQTTSITSATNVSGIAPANVANIVVVAADGVTSLTYSVSYSVATANTNSSLTALSSSVGSLSPTFASGTFDYTVTLPFGSTGAASLTPTLATTLSAISNTGATDVAGSAGANVASVVVTAQDGSTSTYTVTYNVTVGNSNSSLTALTTSVGTLSPTFAAGTLNYTVTLPFGSTGAASVTPTLATTLSVITSNTGATDVAGSAGANVSTVVVTAQDGSTSSYTVTYNVTPANNVATLSDLVSDAGGSLSPVFASGTYAYTVMLPSGTTGGATVTPTLSDVNATITLNTGATDVTTAPNNVATVVITAENGTTTATYTVTFNVSVAVANDATLNTISPNNGSLSPTFVSSITNYTVELPFGSTGTETVTVLTNNALATYTIVDAADVTGAAPANTVTIVVTAQDGVTTSTYTIVYNVTPVNTNSSLTALTSDQGNLSPVFASGTFNYTVTLALGSTGAANITPTLATTLSAITSNTGATDVAGSAGANVATIVVTAQDGSTSTYTVTYNVATSISTDATLSNLTTSVGTIAPSFVSSVTAYNVVLPFGSTGGASITATANNGLATVTSITSATNVAGSVGANEATVIVLAEDGTTSLTYTVTYSVAAANSNTTLSSLTSSQGTLNTAFTSGNFNYTITLPAGSTGAGVLTGVVTTGLSTITSITNATNVAGSSPANTATIVVTAQDGTTATYTVVYTVLTGVNELTNTTSVDVYPNPTHGLATVKVMDGQSNSITVTVLGLTGQVISETIIVNNGLELNHEIDLSKEPKGVYFVKVTGAKTTVTKRVVTF